MKRNTRGWREAGSRNFAIGRIRGESSMLRSIESHLFNKLTTSQSAKLLRIANELDKLYDELATKYFN